jgi:hypothetical protein
MLQCAPHSPPEDQPPRAHPCPRRLHTHPRHHDPEHDPAVHGMREGFWVVCMVSNPVRYKSRYALYRAFRQHVLRDLRANLLTVEVAFAGRAHQVTHNDDAVVRDYEEHGRRVIEVRAHNRSQLWLKEAAWNLGASHLPRSCRYVLFADADITFANPHLVTETIHALQVHPVVQPWVTCADMDPHGDVFAVHRSFAWCHAQGWEWRPVVRRAADGTARVEHYPTGESDGPKPGGRGATWHPGYAIAFRREVLDALPIFDAGILGAGDHHAMACIIGKGRLSVPGGLHPAYLQAVLDWEARAARVLRGDLGYVHGTILHGWHGAKKSRKYLERWKILRDEGYDPTAHVYRNASGLWELSDDAPRGLRDRLREYFRQRDEDLGLVAD